MEVFYCVESAKSSSLSAHFSPLPFRFFIFDSHLARRYDESDSDMKRLTLTRSLHLKLLQSVTMLYVSLG